ncbi:MAG: fatty acid desaturase [Solirubrobacterales bacterium]|nr:fatty acid desaturase [Solirubrobacterales bacterium]
MSSATDSIRTIPDPREPVPLFTWPTISLFVVALAMFVASCWLVVSGAMAWPFGTLINAVAGYMMFTVSHEASHHAASSNRRLNNLLGHLSMPFFALPIGHSAFRYIHMQHHQHTNETDGSDPDAYSMAGGSLLSKFGHWATLDLHYFRFYQPKAGSRPAREKRQTLIAVIAFFAVLALAVATGHLFDWLVLYLLPMRLAVTFLGFAFDYLPHHGLVSTGRENRFQATRNRVGAERVVKWMLLYQNYHLVHHLHPVVPFYRYIRVWRRSEDQYLEQDPALSTVGGRPLTVDEYRQLRHLQHDH